MCENNELHETKLVDKIIDSEFVQIYFKTLKCHQGI